jgi:hypothetical protein
MAEFVQSPLLLALRLEEGSFCADIYERPWSEEHRFAWYVYHANSGVIYASGASSTYEISEGLLKACLKQLAEA